MVDADAVPVKQEIFRVALRYGIKVIMVANSPVNMQQEDWLESVIVSGRFCFKFCNLVTRVNTVKQNVYTATSFMSDLKNQCNDLPMISYK